MKNFKIAPVISCLLKCFLFTALNIAVFMTVENLSLIDLDVAKVLLLLSVFSTLAYAAITCPLINDEEL